MEEKSCRVRGAQSNHIDGVRKGERFAESVAHKSIHNGGVREKKKLQSQWHPSATTMME